MDSQQPSVKKYIIYLIIFSLLGIGFVTLVVSHSSADDDFIYAVDAIGVNLSISIIASLLIMIFFTNRDQRHRRGMAQQSAQKISTMVHRSLDADPRPPLRSPPIPQKIAHRLFSTQLGTSGRARTADPLFRRQML